MTYILVDDPNRHETFMRDLAIRIAKESKDHKTKVGCIVSKGTNILSYGYNGTPSGCDNTMRDGNGKTNHNVIHAEQNAIAKLAKSTLSGEDAHMYTTLLPCTTCATSIIQAGIVRVYFEEFYKDRSALSVFKEAGVAVIHLRRKERGD